MGFTNKRTSWGGGQFRPQRNPESGSAADPDSGPRSGPDFRPPVGPIFGPGTGPDFGPRPNRILAPGLVRIPAQQVGRFPATDMALDLPPIRIKTPLQQTYSLRFLYMFWRRHGVATTGLQFGVRNSVHLFRPPRLEPQRNCAGRHGQITNRPQNKIRNDKNSNVNYERRNEEPAGRKNISRTPKHERPRRAPPPLCPTSVSALAHLLHTTTQQAEHKTTENRRGEPLQTTGTHTRGDGLINRSRTHTRQPGGRGFGVQCWRPRMLPPDMKTGNHQVLKKKKPPRPFVFFSFFIHLVKR